MDLFKVRITHHRPAIAQIRNAGEVYSATTCRCMTGSEVPLTLTGLTGERKMGRQDGTGIYSWLSER